MKTNKICGKIPLLAVTVYFIGMHQEFGNTAKCVINFNANMVLPQKNHSTTTIMQPSNAQIIQSTSFLQNMIQFIEPYEVKLMANIQIYSTLLMPFSVSIIAITACLLYPHKG